ncbi:MAG: amidohydrolase family protein [Saprospiraceae bacterium]
MRKITADYICTVEREAKPIEKGVVIVDDQGKVLKIDKRDDHDPASLETHRGVIIPGFINTHCHLELSHMKGKVATGTSLIPFISNVVTFRDSPEEEIMAAIAKADEEMYQGGIVAVGDISNKTDTKAQKEKSKINYYTFVEMFDFMQDDWAEKEYEKYIEVYEAQAEGNGNKKSAVPHAPYSVSKSLFQKINAVNNRQATVSIHNQETPPENELFLQKKGAFLDFYKGFNISLDAFEATGQTAIYYALANMNQDCKTLFVHNTLTTKKDIEAAQSWNNNVYWATCPNANLYIENRLPNYQHFLDTNARVTIGTDSLTSNWQLSILEEMKTISRFQSYVSLETLLKWATINGAEALGYDETLGSITVGKTPGLSLLNLNKSFQLKADTTVQKLV